MKYFETHNFRIVNESIKENICAYKTSLCPKCYLVITLNSLEAKLFDFFIWEIVSVFPGSFVAARAGRSDV